MPKKRFNIDEYPGEYVMYCENQEELFKFYDYLHKVGRKWCTGYSYNEQRPTADFGDRRIHYIYFNNGTYGSYHNATAKPDYTVLNFKDFDWGDSTMKFKVGDKVRVKNDLKTWRKYGDYTYTEGMREMLDGKVATIAHVDHGLKYYHLVEGRYCWTDEMLELVEENQFTKADLKPGMVVEYRYGDRELVLGNKTVDFEGCHDLNAYNDDLTAKCSTPYADIVKAFTVNDSVGDIDDITDSDHLTLVWERKEAKKEHKYKVGDRVRVRTDLETTRLYGDIGVINHMMSDLGKTLTISSLEETDFYGEYCPHYHVKENQWNWTDEMFEGLVEYEEMTVAEIEEKLGYKVKIVDGDSK